MFRLSVLVQQTRGALCSAGPRYHSVLLSEPRSNDTPVGKFVLHAMINEINWERLHLAAVPVLLPPPFRRRDVRLDRAGGDGLHSAKN